MLDYWHFLSPSLYSSLWPYLLVSYPVCSCMGRAHSLWIIFRLTSWGHFGYRLYWEASQARPIIRPKKDIQAHLTKNPVCAPVTFLQNGVIERTRGRYLQRFWRKTNLVQSRVEHLNMIYNEMDDMYIQGVGVFEDNSMEIHYWCVMSRVRQLTFPWFLYSLNNVFLNGFSWCNGSAQDCKLCHFNGSPNLQLLIGLLVYSWGCHDGSW